MGAGAPIGNKNAEIWDLKKSNKLYDKALKLSTEKIRVSVSNGKYTRDIEGYKYDFIGEIARDLGVYHNLITRDLPNRFPELNKLKLLLLSNLESNCYENAKKGIIKEASGIINLKSNYNWTDRREYDHKSSDMSMSCNNWINETSEELGKKLALIKQLENKQS